MPWTDSKDGEISKFIDQAISKILKIDSEENFSWSGYVNSSGNITIGIVIITNCATTTPIGTMTKQTGMIVEILKHLLGRFLLPAP